MNAAELVVSERMEGWGVPPNPRMETPDTKSGQLSDHDCKCAGKRRSGLILLFRTRSNAACTVAEVSSPFTTQPWSAIMPPSARLSGSGCSLSVQDPRRQLAG